MLLTELAQQSIASAGTPQVLTATKIHAEAVIFSCPSTNTGSVWIGSSSLSTTRFIYSIPAGGSFQMAVDPTDKNDSAAIKLETLYIDGTTTGNKLNVGYMINQP
jgi:hypothetical protein